MVTWCLEHPWMTFSLVILLLVVIDQIQGNYFKCKYEKLTRENPKLKKEEVIEQYKNSSNENFYKEN